jgi:hypothetical protein
LLDDALTYSAAGPLPAHSHAFGPVEHAPFTGTPHRKCQLPGCATVSLDLEPEPEEA